MGVPLDENLQALPIGRGEVLREGPDILLIGIGSTVYPCLEAASKLEGQGIEATVVNARFVKPLDRELLLGLAEKIGRVVTVEENVLAGGFGSAVLEMFQEAGFFPGDFVRLGLPDSFIPHGSQSILRSMHGIDADGIQKAALGILQARHGQVLRAIGQVARR